MSRVVFVCDFSVPGAYRTFGSGGHSATLLIRLQVGLPVRNLATSSVFPVVADKTQNKYVSGRRYDTNSSVGGDSGARCVGFVFPCGVL